MLKRSAGSAVYFFMKNKPPQIGFGLFFGIITAHILGGAAWIPCVAAAVMSAADVFAEYFRIKKDPLFSSYPKKSRPLSAVQFSRFSFALLAFSAGISIFLMIYQNPDNYYFDGETAEFSGIILEDREYSGDFAVYSAKGQITDGMKTVNSKILIPSNGLDFSYGDEISFSGKFSRLKDNADFPEETYYFSKGVYLEAQISVPPSVSGNSGNFFLKKIYSYSDYAGERISVYFPGEKGALLRAVFLGDKSALSAEMKRCIRHTGLSHLAAVSGMHLGVIAVLGGIGIFALGIRGHTGTVCMIVITLVFMALFKFTPSVNRSGAMIISSLLLSLSGGDRFSAFQRIGTAMFAVCSLDPLSAIDPGFQMSCAGAFGIAVFGQYVNHYILKYFYGDRPPEPFDRRVYDEFEKLDRFGQTVKFYRGMTLDLLKSAEKFSEYDYGSACNVLAYEKYEPFFPEFKVRMLCAGVSAFCVNICVLPLSGIYFGGFSLAGMFLTLAVYPIFFVMFAGTLVFVLSGCTLGAVFSLAGIASGIFGHTVNFFGNIPELYIPLSKTFLAAWSAATVIFTVRTVRREKPEYKRLGNEREKITRISPLRTVTLSAVSMCLFLSVSFGFNIYLQTKPLVLLHPSKQYGYFIFSYKNSAVAVFASDKKNMDVFAKEDLFSRGHDRADLVILLSERYNNTETFREFPAEVFVSPDFSGTKTYSVGGGEYTVYIREGEVLIASKDFSVSYSGEGLAPFKPNFSSYAQTSFYFGDVDQKEIRIYA